MATLTLGTRVGGTDKPIGKLTALVCDPITDEATHLVVNADDVIGSERLVPIALVDHRDDQQVTLTVTRHAYFDLETFETHRFVRVDDDDGMWHLPLERDDAALTFAPHERIPASEVALWRGTRVYDRDGHRVGRVHRFVVDPDSHGITHLTLQHGHVFGHQEVTIPAADVRTMTEQGIHLLIPASEVSARIDADA